ncbi:MAG: signal peptidase I [Spirochaetia bacterium]
MVLPLVLSLLLLRGFGMELLQVQGVSMEPVIRAESTIFVNRAAYGLQTPFTNDYVIKWARPRKGDIVVFTTPGTERLAVKRVVAGPGERYKLTGLGLLFEETIPVSVPVAEEMRGADRLAGDEVFVLGDNRQESVDSRMYGPVALERIRGRVFIPSGSGFVGSDSDRY